MRTWLILTVLFAGSGCPVTGSEPVSVLPSAQEVGRYERIEFRIAFTGLYDDPYDPSEVEVALLVTPPGQDEHLVPAFIAQDYEIQRQGSQQGRRVETLFYPIGAMTWKARYAPQVTGEHRARVRVRDRHGERSSESVTFRSIESASKGFLRASDTDPRFLEFDNGEDFLAIGQNVAFIGESQYVNLAKVDEVFADLATNGANFVRIWTGCKDWALCLEGRKSAWSRSWSRPAPLVAHPGGEEGRRCLELVGASGPLDCSPTRTVALRPGTRYVLSGRFQAEAESFLELHLGHGAGPTRFTPRQPGQWTEFRQSFTTASDGLRLGPISVAAAGEGPVLLEGLSLTEAGGGPELLAEADVNRPIRGRYHQIDSAMLDEVVRSAERHGIYLMLCLLNRDLYMEDLSEVGSAAYEQATADALKFLRYCVARWGASTAVGAWEYFNEMDPGKPTDVFYEALGRSLATLDSYRHPRTTSTWHPSARDVQLASIDLGQLHHYMRPGDAEAYRDEVAAVVERTRWLREHGPAKPVLIGEFGLATAQWGLSEAMKADSLGVHFRQSLWASAFAGSSGTAMFWWWEELDRQDAYRHYRPLAQFLKGLSFVGLRSTTASAADPMRVLGYQGEDRAYLWVQDKRASWHAQVIERQAPTEVTGVRIGVAGLVEGRYRVTWWDTRSGEVVRDGRIEVSDSAIELVVPGFVGDIACKLERG